MKDRSFRLIAASILAATLFTATPAWAQGANVQCVGIPCSTYYSHQSGITWITPLIPQRPDVNVFSNGGQWTGPVTWPSQKVKKRRGKRR